MNNNCNPSYQRALNLVNEYQSTYHPSCCCGGTRGIVGPTGPTGPAGPAGGPTGPTCRLYKSSK